MTTFRPHASTFPQVREVKGVDGYVSQPQARNNRFPPLLATGNRAPDPFPLSPSSPLGSDINSEEAIHRLAILPSLPTFHSHPGQQITPLFYVDQLINERLQYSTIQSNLCRVSPRFKVQVLISPTSDQPRSRYLISRYCFIGTILHYR
jgi:hypothetical protein